MKSVKKFLMLILVALTVMYIPVTVMASGNDEKMMEEMQNYRGTTMILDENKTRTLKDLSVKFTRSYIITVNRSSTSKDLILNLFVSHNLDTAVFNSDKTKIIGSTKTFLAGQNNTAIWSAEELGSETQVHILLSTYQDVSSSAYGTVNF